MAETGSMPTTAKQGTLAKLGLEKAIAQESDRLEPEVRQALKHFLQTHKEMMSISPLSETIEKIEVTVTNPSPPDSGPSSSRLEQTTSTLELLLFLKP